MDQRVSLITLGVADLARARSFYEALGWRSDSPPEIEVVFFQAGGLVLGLWSREYLAEDGPPLGGPLSMKKPAASYSPRPLRAKYHRR